MRSAAVSSFVGNTLNAVVASPAVLRQLPLPGAVIPIGRHLAMLPVSDEEPGPTAFPIFRSWPTGFARTLAGWSRFGALAYVQSDLTHDEQAAVVFADGELVLGPLQTHPDPVEDPPIAQALRRLEDTANARAAVAHIDHWFRTAVSGW